MFDANGFHRALIPCEEGDPEPAWRLVLQVDFMDIQSSDFTSNLNLGPCAPGQAPLLFTPQEIGNSFLDASCLNYIGDDLYLYCKPARLNEMLSLLDLDIDA